MLYVKDLKNTIYIGIDNVENINCYFITSLQILHSSDTVKNFILKNKEYLLKEFPQLFTPLIIYEEGIKNISNNLDIENVSELAIKIKKSIYDNPPMIRDGYNWLAMLLNYYIPIFYNLLDNKNDIFKILQEISLEPRQYATDLRYDLNFLNNDAKNKLLIILKEYSKELNEIVNKYYEIDKILYYNCIALETYIEDDKYGHVFPIVRNENGLFILDNHYLESLQDYLIKRNHITVEKLRLNYYSHDLLTIFNKYLNTIEKDYNGFVVNQYSLVFRKFDIYLRNNNLIPKHDFIAKITEENKTDNKQETISEHNNIISAKDNEINKLKSIIAEKSEIIACLYNKLNIFKYIIFCFLLCLMVFAIIKVIRKHKYNKIENIEEIETD